jgi:hypothetical protein
MSDLFECTRADGRTCFWRVRVLRSNSPFVVATAGGMLSLVGDKLWLGFDWLLKPLVGDHWHWLAYTVIGGTFLVGMALMAWSVVLFRRNGHALQEVKAEIGYRRQLLLRRRFRHMCAAEVR